MKALDLGMFGAVHFYGAFVTDLRARHLAEAKNAALLEQLERQAMSDALTGLPNRRAFEVEAGRIVARAKRSGGAPSRSALPTSITSRRSMTSTATRSATRCSMRSARC
ncbi:GGDEF domain-containing protein [Massilia sp. B-10]|nr:GGDEF domain-containing protein [Massilia sp. B-10]